jgi:hypothetical protein
MTRSTLNAFKWWRGLTAIEQLVVEVVGAVFLASLLASAATLLW